MLKVKRIKNNPIDSNCYVIYDKALGDDCIIVDPGSEDNSNLYDLLNSENLYPQYIILTHEHFDHCWGVDLLVEKYHIPIVCSQLCAEAIKYEKRNCSVFYNNKEAFTIKSETISVESIGNELRFGDDVIHFYNTPGHTDASLSFLVSTHLFTGDTLIKNMRTVTKLPTGSLCKLKSSLELFLSMQGNGYMVYPGHGVPFKLDEYDLSKSER